MITITKPGLLTTIQDLGRYQYQKYGVVVGGAMDTIAHRIANILVGNDEHLPTIEMTLIGPTIQFHKDTLIAICGGDLSPTINGKEVRTWRAIFVKKGSELKFCQCKAGCRAYLAVAGGYRISSIMGSNSTYVRAGIGGFKGRALHYGDQLSIGILNKKSKKIMDALKDRGSSEFIETLWSVTTELRSFYQKDSAIRIMRGRQFHLFSEDSQDKLCKARFEVTPQSDRMGYRLKGTALQLKRPEEMISEAVCFGTIQVPADGNPIILLADRQTTGGYPKIGQVATVDLPFVSQAKPGDLFRFKEISHEQAQRLLLKREQQLRQLKQGVTDKFNTI